MFPHKVNALTVVLFAALASANSKRSIAVAPEVRGKQSMSALRRDDRWGPANHLLRGCLLVERDTKRARGDYEIIVELQNRCGHAAKFDFDPKDLKVEVFDGEGKLVKEPVTVRSGPIPQPHHGVISPGTYVGLTTHRGGIPFDRRGALFAAGWQCWTLAPGKYVVRATASVSLQHAEKVLEPMLPTRSSSADTVLPVGMQKSVKLDLGATIFEVPAADADDDS